MKNKKAAPGGDPDAARNKVIALEVYAGSAAGTKTARQRYVRLFPERLAFLLLHLEPEELVAYLRLLSFYAASDGDVRDDVKTLARVVALPPRQWSALRHRLIALGLLHVQGDRLVDADQQANLEIQRKVSERQRARVLKRWRG